MTNKTLSLVPQVVYESDPLAMAAVGMAKLAEEHIALSSAHAKMFGGGFRAISDQLWSELKKNEADQRALLTQFPELLTRFI